MDGWMGGGVEGGSQGCRNAGMQGCGRGSQGSQGSQGCGGRGAGWHTCPICSRSSVSRHREGFLPLLDASCFTPGRRLGVTPPRAPCGCTLDHVDTDEISERGESHMPILLSPSSVRGGVGAAPTAAEEAAEGAAAVCAAALAGSVRPVSSAASMSDSTCAKKRKKRIN